MLNIGDKIPEFCLPNQDEEEICFRDIKGRWAVIYFYPKDNTPGCTTQACDFTEAQPNFSALDTIILGVSPDSPKRHRNFIEKRGLGITLLSDESKELCKLFGVWQLKKSFGKEYMGVVRSTFLIAPDGRLAYKWEKVRVKGHIDAVKEKLTELSLNANI
jgi:peroxiredoxin Q/BCP